MKSTTGFFEVLVLSLIKKFIMFRTLLVILLLTGITVSPAVRSQQRIAAAAANLQVTGKSWQGEEVTATSRSLVILYENRIGKGEMDLGSLNSSNDEVNELLASLKGKIIYIQFDIPEGKFAFRDSMNERFSTQGELRMDDNVSEFTLELDVSNIRDSKENAFKVIGRGRLSLSGHFGLSEDASVEDSFGFIFNQNLNVFQP